LEWQEQLVLRLLAAAAAQAALLLLYPARRSSSNAVPAGSAGAAVILEMGLSIDSTCLVRAHIWNAMLDVLVCLPLAAKCSICCLCLMAGVGC
jgi:hypothetical protein